MRDEGSTEGFPQLPKRYLVSRSIGEGATGTVWQARDQILDMEVAVKVVRRNLAVHRRFRTRFAREVALSAQCVHPRLVPIHDFGRTQDECPFVAMAYAPDGNLGDFLTQGPRLETVLRLLDQVLDALATLHARGVVHQDLKPHNVLLWRTPDKQLQAWVADLGEANALSILAQDRKGVGGTPAFMAPEQFLQKPQLMGPWTDLYAVGLLLYEALCDRPPHPMEGRKELLEARQKPPPPMSRADGGRIPEILEEVVESLLDPEPRQRYDRAADVRRVLSRALHDMETGVRIRPLRTRTRSAEGSGSAGPVLPDGAAPLSASAPARVQSGDVLQWNQVMPDPMPPEPPREFGYGATARASLALFALREIPFVGRLVERQAIWDMARRIQDRAESSVVIVVGDSGTGKTRLVESIARPLDEGGYMEVFRLRYHSPPGLDDGYRGAVLEILSPWQDDKPALEQRLARWLSRDRQVPPETLSTEAAVLARWCGFLEPDEVPVNSAVGLAFLYRHLDARSWRGGACLVLDDVHRSAEEGDGLAIAQALLDRSVGDRPVLVLATLAAESIQSDEKLKERVEHLERSGALVLHLPCLTLDETRQLLNEALLLHPTLTDAAAQICSGNPLAVSLLLRDWANRDLLVMGQDSLFHLRPETPIEDAVPSSIDALYLKRLEAAVRFGEDQVATAESIAATALAGQDPPTMVVREFSESGLDVALTTGVLREEGSVLLFEHGSLQRTARHLARRLPDVPDIHRRLASAWLTVGERTGRNVNLSVGYHLLKGKDPQGAAAPLLKAVRTLIEEGRSGLAMSASDLALDAADRCGSTLYRQEARRLAAEARLEEREYETAEQLIREALTLEPIDRLSWARLHLLLSRAAMGKGDLDSCRRYLETAGMAFETVRDREGLRDVAHGRASLERLEGNPHKAIEHFHEALRLLRKDPRREVLILSGFIEALLTAGQPMGLDGIRQRMLQVAHDSGDTRNIAKAAYTSGIIFLYRRKLDLSKRYLVTASALSSTLGDHWLHLNCENNLGEVARFRGEVDTARRHYELYTRIAAEQGLESAAAVGHLNLALLAMQQQDDDEVERQICLTEDCLTQQPRHWTWVFIGLIRAEFMARKGNEARCRAWWFVAREHGLTSLRTPDLWLPLQRLAESAAAAGWQDIAQSANRLAREVGAGSQEAQVTVEEEEEPGGGVR